MTNEDQTQDNDAPAPPPAVDPNFGAPEPALPPASLQAVEKRVPTGAEMGTRGVQLRNLKELAEFSRMAFQSNLAPAAFKSPQAVAVAIQTGMEHGLTPLAALKAVYVVNGLPAWRGEAALGLVRASGLMTTGSYRAWIEGEGDQMVACCQSRRVGESMVTTTFSVQDATVAGLWGKRGGRGQDTPWITYPKRMLLWRAIAFHLKDVYPDVLGGAPIAEEAVDIEARARDAEPKKSLMAAVAGPVSEDKLLAAGGVTVSSPEPQETGKTGETDVFGTPSIANPAYKADQALKNAIVESLVNRATEGDDARFANMIAAMESPQDHAELERFYYSALTAAGADKAKEKQANDLLKKMLKKFPKPGDSVRG